MEKKQKEKNIVNSGIAGGAAETVQRYGSAVKEHVVAYSGKDNENNSCFHEKFCDDLFSV